MALDDVTTVGHNPFPTDSELYFRVGERDIAWHNTRTDEHVGITEEKALVREYAGGGMWLANVGKNYKLVKNSDLFPYVEKQLCRVIAHKYLQDVTTVEKKAYGGRDCYREYVFNDMKCGVERGDVAFRLIIGNSYGSKAVSLLYGAIDFWCDNGMVIGSHEKQVRKHTSGISLRGIGAWIDDAVLQFAKHGQRLEEWEATPIAHDKEDVLFTYLNGKGLLSGAMARKMQNDMHTERNKRSGRDNCPTLWDLYSALTAWASHSEVRNTGNDHEANTRIQRSQHAERVIKAAERAVVHGGAA